MPPTPNGKKPRGDGGLHHVRGFFRSILRGTKMGRGVSPSELILALLDDALLTGRSVMVKGHVGKGNAWALVTARGSQATCIAGHGRGLAFGPLLYRP
jgi:hypothetical protein